VKAAVYPFNEVLRALRQQGGEISILRAAELTRYGNYGRWESGQTKVGADHLLNIAGAFGVEGEFWLLVYAWLIDQSTPAPGCGPVEISEDELVAQLPSGSGGLVDLGHLLNAALGEVSHTELALRCLVARYGGGYEGADRPVRLRPTERVEKLLSTPHGVSVLRGLYGDVLGACLECRARTFILGGLRKLPASAQRMVDRETLLITADPESFGQLLAAGAPPPGSRQRGLNRLAALAARLAPQMQRLAACQIEDLRRFEEERQGAPVSADEVKARMRRAAADDSSYQLPPMLPETIDADTLPEPDPGLVRQTRARFNQVDRAVRRALKDELDDARATANPRAAFDALHVLEDDPPEG